MESHFRVTLNPKPTISDADWDIPTDATIACVSHSQWHTHTLLTRLKLLQKKMDPNNSDQYRSCKIGAELPPPCWLGWSTKPGQYLTYSRRKSFIKKGQIPDARSAILMDDLKLHLVKIMWIDVEHETRNIFHC